MNMRTITFNELRKIKDSLPSGSMHDAKRGEGDDIFRDLEHNLAALVDELDNGFGLIAQREQRHTEEHAEHDDLQHVGVRHRLDDIGGEPTDNIVDKAVGLGLGCLGGGKELRCPLAGLDDQTGNHAAGRGNDSRDDDPQNVADTDGAQLFDIAHLADTAGNTKEHQGHDEHFQHAKEDVAKRRNELRSRGRYKADNQTDHNAN